MTYSHFFIAVNSGSINFDRGNATVLNMEIRISFFDNTLGKVPASLCSSWSVLLQWYFTSHAFKSDIYWIVFVTCV
jgi:hypothetical protein